MPGVIIGYPAPARHSPDYYALGMIDVVLTGGPSSRFQLDLVKGKESVIQYEAEIGWPFASHHRLQGPRRLRHVPALQAELHAASRSSIRCRTRSPRSRTKAWTAKELERARTLLRSERITSLQSSLHRAQLLGQYEILDGKPELINTDLEKFLAVTPAQIQAAAKKYLTPERRSVLEICQRHPSRKPLRAAQGEPMMPNPLSHSYLQEPY